MFFMWPQGDTGRYKQYSGKSPTQTNIFNAKNLFFKDFFKNVLFIFGGGEEQRERDK